jgi:hypothetical protein
MFTNIFASLSLVCMLVAGVSGIASAHDGDRGGGGNRWDDRGGWSDNWGNKWGGHKDFGSDPSAPELDPTVLGSGAAILAGGLMLLNERRRVRK